MFTPLVIFAFQAASAKQVFYAGDLTSWEHPAAMKQTDSTWSFQADLPSDARVEYKYVVDGKWVLDRSAPKSDNGFGGFNSYWQGPDYKMDIPDFKPLHPMKRQVLTVGGREVVVYSPASSSGLPILTYADGDTYEARGKVQNVVENLVEQGKIRPVVLVLITPHDREQEYWENSQPYEKFFVSEVLPAVRSATGCSPNASDVYVGGSSLGGTISLRLAEDYPSFVAGGIHSQSGAFQVDVRDISEKSLGKLAPGIKLYLDYGTYEQPLTRADDMAVFRLKAFGFNYKSFTTPEGHCWTAWRHRMVAGLEFLLPPSSSGTFRREALECESLLSLKPGSLLPTNKNQPR
jgi:enterochelin esterase-like enzyme